MQMETSMINYGETFFDETAAAINKILSVRRVEYVVIQSGRNVFFK